MLAVKQSPEFIQDSRRGLALECTNHVAQDDGRRVAHQEMDMVGVAVDLCDFRSCMRRQEQVSKRKSLRSAVSICLRNVVQNTTWTVRW